MSEMNLKEELLKQNGHVSVSSEVSRLHEIIDAERRRVRRLTRWTIGVWLTWFLLISVGLVVPYVLAHTSGPPNGTTTQPLNQPPPIRHSSSPMAAILGGIVGVVMFAVIFGLPVTGVILVITLIFTHRAASLNQIRASLGTIEAQLRALTAAERK